MRPSIKTISALALLSLTSAAMAEQIDNPQYTQWSKYKVGTYVTLQQSMEMPGMPQMANMMPQTKITTKVTEIKPDSLTLEVTTTTTQNGQSRDNKTTQTVPAKIDKPATTGTAAPAGMPPGVTGEVKDLKEGKETVEVKGTKLDTATREFTTSVSGMPMGRGAAGGGAPTTAHMKIWSSDDVPGGMVKTETTTTMQGMGEMKMNMAVVDYAVVK